MTYQGFGLRLRNIRPVSLEPLVFASLGLASLELVVAMAGIIQSGLRVPRVTSSELGTRLLPLCGHFAWRAVLGCLQAEDSGPNELSRGSIMDLLSGNYRLVRCAGLGPGRFLSLFGVMPCEWHRDQSRCSASGSLPGHAAGVIRRCEALGTMYSVRASREASP